MKTEALKKLIKDAVREAIQDELKDILLEAVRSNKQPIRESYQVSDDRTLNFNSNSIPKSSTDTKQAYMDILGDIAKGPKTGLEGEFRVNGLVNTMSEGSSLPEGQLGLDQIMGLIGGK
jgi:hypothetical protein